MNLISIAGIGTVGSAVYSYFRNLKPLIYDKYKNYPMAADFFDSKFIFITLPTPTIAGRQDVSELRDFIFSHGKTDPIYIIKSTILPFHAKNFIEEFRNDGYKIVCNPEFLNAISAIEDMENEKNIILGGDIVNCLSVAGLFSQIKSHLEFHIMSAEEAMFLKYIHNMYGALKVTFWNEIQDILLTEKIDIRKITNVLKQMTNWNNNYEVIAADGKKGFGGSCYPKDLAAFVTQYNSDFLHSIQVQNMRWRNYDEEFSEML